MKQRYKKEENLSPLGQDIFSIKANAVRPGYADTDYDANNYSNNNSNINNSNNNHQNNVNNRIIYIPSQIPLPIRTNDVNNNDDDDDETKNNLDLHDDPNNANVILSDTGNGSAVNNNNSTNYVKPDYINEDASREKTNKSHSYRFPVFAEGVDAFKEARKDPLACNIGNDMVIVWKDVVQSENEFTTPDSTNSKSMRDLTVSQVFDNLCRAAEQHGKLKSRTTRRKELDFCSKPSEFSASRKGLQNIDTSDFSLMPNYTQHRGSKSVCFCSGEHSCCSVKTQISADPDYVRKSVHKSSAVFHNDSVSIEGSVPKSSWRLLERGHVGVLEPPIHPASRTRNYSPSTSNSSRSEQQLQRQRRQQQQQKRQQYQKQKKQRQYEATLGDSVEHYHEHYTDFSNDPPVTFILSCNAACPCHCPRNEFWISGDDCPCCRCCFQIDSVSSQKPPRINSSNSFKLIPCCCNRNYYISQRHQQEEQQQQSEPKVHPAYGDDNLSAKPTSHLEQKVIIECGYLRCSQRTRTPRETSDRSPHKSCHHCFTAYCSSACRQDDWFRHKSFFCYGSLVSSTCKEVIRFSRKDDSTKGVLSRLAMRGYLSHGRGCLLMGFPNLSSAQEFLEEGVSSLAMRPAYVSLKEMSCSRIYGGVNDRLIDLCQQYNPKLKYVLNIGIGLCRDQKAATHARRDFQRLNATETFCQCSHFGNMGCCSQCLTCGQERVPDSMSHFHPWTLSRHKAPILQKSVKLRLQTGSIPFHEHHLIFERHWWDEYRTSGPTLILTSVPGSHSQRTSRRSRELSLANIQRKLRYRGVNLRQQFPDVYDALISYVSNGTHFPSQVLHPLDTKTKKIFTCFLMPEAEAELEWMQSHFLLDDLELSRDSINRSMSESDSRSFL